MRVKKLEKLLEKNGFELVEDQTNALGYGMTDWKKHVGDELIHVSVSVYQDREIKIHGVKVDTRCRH